MRAPPSSPQSVAALDSKIEQLTSTISAFSSRFDNLEKLLSDTKEENNSLKEHLQAKDQEILDLKEKLNDVEQYQRSWSIRVLNVPIPKEDSTSNSKVMRHLYDKVLAPILRGAVDKKLLPSIPPVEQLLETAHILPSKAEKTPPIIARFYTRNTRSLIFQRKKEFAPRHPTPHPQPPVPQPGSKPSLGKLAYPIFEDLTKDNFAKMRELAEHQSVLSSWTVAGSIRFRLKNETTVRRVKSVYDSVDIILARK